MSIKIILPEVQIHHIGYFEEGVLHKQVVLVVLEILQQKVQLLVVESGMELLQVDKEAAVVVCLFPLLVCFVGLTFFLGGLFFRQSRLILPANIFFQSSNFNLSGKNAINK